LPDIRDWLTDYYNTSKDSFLDTLTQLNDSVGDTVPAVIKSAIIVGVGVLSAVIVGHTAVYVIYRKQKKKKN